MPRKAEISPFYLHKVALRPLLSKLNKKETKALFNELESIDQKEFVTFLYRHGLAQMWLSFLLKQEAIPVKYQDTIKEFKLEALKIAANQLMQRAILEETKNIFKTNWC